MPQTRETQTRSRRQSRLARHRRTAAIALVLALAVAGAVAWLHARRHIADHRQRFEFVAMGKTRLYAALLKNDLCGGLAAAQSLRGGALLLLPGGADSAGRLSQDDLAGIVEAGIITLPSEFIGAAIIPAPGQAAPDSPETPPLPDRRRRLASYFRITESREVEQASPDARRNGAPGLEKSFTSVRDTRQPSFDGPFPPSDGEGSSAWITVPVIRNDRFLGTAGVEVRLDGIVRTLGDRSGVPSEGAVVMLVAPDGTLVPPPPAPLDAGRLCLPVGVGESGDRRRLNPKAVPGAAEALANGRPFSVTLPILKGGETALLAGVPLRPGNDGAFWLLATVTPTDSVDQDAVALIWESLALGLGAALLAAFLGVLAGSRLTGMLDDRRRWLEAMLDRLPTPLVIRGAENREVQFINRAVEESLGVKNRRALIGRVLPIQDPFGLSGPNPSQPADLEFYKDDRCYRIHTLRVDDEDGNPLSIIEVATDITGEKTLKRILTRLCDTAKGLDDEVRKTAQLGDDVRDGVLRQALGLHHIAVAAADTAEMAAARIVPAERRVKLLREICEQAEKLEAALPLVDEGAASEMRGILNRLDLLKSLSLEAAEAMGRQWKSILEINSAIQSANANLVPILEHAGRQAVAIKALRSHSADLKELAEPRVSSDPAWN